MRVSKIKEAPQKNITNHTQYVGKLKRLHKTRQQTTCSMWAKDTCFSCFILRERNPDTSKTGGPHSQSGHGYKKKTSCSARNQTLKPVTLMSDTISYYHYNKFRPSKFLKK
jgi:hypothetical protein